ncbi:CubicO group peptidase, beta-lactamase class C family [Salegentibacter holothuriorum]|uniref:CubicO group peptidase, beta-lactamase class C family n=1 Tax=Salegentibacter holothuriorum TaxID=241145 RepID=A0A1T5AK72_9FLAO|nr:serine hydrolase domain-containing protein [Salegentibacter holothuriorum]SKB35177.1 CubicO group peptidase, beta-lactamase class C family [Salegentibacter holothuriorum]
MKNYITLILIFALALSCKQKENSKTSPTKENSAIKDSLTTELEKIKDKKNIVGFSASIVTEKGILYNKGFGYSNVETQKELTEHTIQNIASISKTLIGLSLFKAQEMGKLELDDPINKYLPFQVVNPSHPNIPITIRHLSTHTSTIMDSDNFWENTYILKKKDHPKSVSVFGYMKPPDSKTSLANFLESLLTNKGKLYIPDNFSKEKPGDKFSYSNLGATLCALVIESATKTPYDQFTQENILNPLEMGNSGWSIKTVDSTKISKLYGNYESVLADYSILSYPDGGLLTTSSDLSKLLTEFIKGYAGKGTLLSKESYKKLFENQLSESQMPEGTNANFGIFLDFSKGFMEDDFKTIGHSGGDPGVVAGMFFNPETGLGRILILNTDSDFDDNVIPQFKEIWSKLNIYGNKLN